MKKKNPINSYKVIISGLNIEKLINRCKESQIEISNITRENYKEAQMDISYANYDKAIKQGVFNGYTVKKQDVGFRQLKQSLVKNIGLVAGICVAVFLFVFFSLFTFSVQISGLDKLSRSDILQALQQAGINTGKINSFNVFEVEQALKERFEEISMVSIKKTGTSILINVKEKIPNETEDLNAITAPQNLLITKMQVVQGTAVKRVGDVVKKGESMVLPFTLTSSGEEAKCKPIAIIECDAWYGATIQFNEKETEFVRTGKKATVGGLEIMGVKIFNSAAAIPFAKYEEVVYNNYTSPNFFLPIRVNQSVYYELKEKVVERNFEENREKLLKESKQEAYKMFPKNLQVLEENTEITKVGSVYYINTYLKTSMVIKE